MTHSIEVTLRVGSDVGFGTWNLEFGGPGAPTPGQASGLLRVRGLEAVAMPLGTFGNTVYEECAKLGFLVHENAVFDGNFRGRCDGAPTGASAWFERPGSST